MAAVAAKSGADWLTLHARTASQGYSGSADWNLIRRVREASPVPVVGNGDISDAAAAVEKLNNCGCRAVMIGRAALGNPYIFLQCSGLLRGETPKIPAPKKLLGRLHELLMEHADRREAATRLKKLAVWYSSGMKGKSAFRQKMFLMRNNPDEILAAAMEFLTEERFKTKIHVLPEETP